MSDRRTRDPHARMTLPPLPYVAHRILLATLDERTQAGDLAGLLRDEPGLAARTVAAANAAWFAGRQRIDDLSSAVVRLGLERLRVLVTGLLVAPAFDPRRCNHFDAARFWRHSVATGFAASQLAPRARPPVADAPAGLAGLLRNIGLLLLASAFPDDTDRALQPATTDDTPLLERLRTEVGADHHEASVMLLEAWDLPATVIRAVSESFADEAGAGNAPAAVVRAAAEWAAAGFEPEWIEAGDLPRSAFDATRRTCRQEWARLEKTAALMARG